MARSLEYLEEALEEAEAAARWYADRSLTAVAGFSSEIDAAEEAIAEFPDAWPSFENGTRRYFASSLSASSIELNRGVF